MIATCQYCQSSTDLTISQIEGNSIVACSTCGGTLGTVDELRYDRPSQPIAAVALSGMINRSH